MERPNRISPAEVAAGLQERTAKDLSLIAYRTTRVFPMRMVPSPVGREWMDATTDHFANRCLPLLLANQAGWVVLNSHAFIAAWDGGNALSSIQVHYLTGSPPYPASSHFGFGILTWNLPYLYRTPPGYDLLVRGPANMPKDGIAPLEGLVETDWAVATFTMNWQITRAHYPVTFDVGEPICMLVPQRRGELEAFQPEIRELDEDSELAVQYRTWSASRDRMLAHSPERDPEEVRRGWQRHYFRGTSPGGATAAEHQTRLHLQEFREAPPAG